MTLHQSVQRDAIERGIDFLLSHRSGDGWWRDFETLAGESDEWITAYIGCCLAQAPGGDRAAQEALELLLSRRRTVGWGYNEKVPSDCDTTAWVCRLIEVLDWTVLDEYHQAVDFLQSAMTNTGGIPTYPNDAAIRFYTGASDKSDFSGWTMPHICVTANVASLRAFQHEEKMKQYLSSSQRRDGSWSGYWWVDRAYPTMLASVAVGNDSRAVQWAKTPEDQTAFGLACRMNMGAPVTDQLMGMQQSDGGWPASARLRIPAPFITDPEDTAVRISLDHNRIYTTATAVLSCHELFQN